MEIRYVTLDTCAQATGLVVAIDVIRAFTTACFAFEAGVEEIVLVSTVEEAFAVRNTMPDALMMGEVRGLRPEGFDYGNSPSALLNLDLSGRRMIQRTSAGTQGVVLSTGAEMLMAASFVCAGTTAAYIQSLRPESVTFVRTDSRPGGYGEEDAACADYLAELLRGEMPNVAPYLTRVLDSRTGRKIRTARLDDMPLADLDCCVDVDRMDFALRVERLNGLHVMKPVRV